MNDIDGKQKFTDKLERQSFFNVGTVIKLSELEKIKSNSLDLVMCMIGFHHYSEDELERILMHCNRILRKDGKLQIREHHATQDIMHRIHCAHGVFNAVTDVPESEEKRERRNFHTIPQWRVKIEPYGFEDIRRYQLQKNDCDPTRDYLITYKKVKDLSINSIMSSYSSCLKRNMEYTLFTLPEWFIVEYTKNYGKFMETTVYYEFPYMYTMITFIKLVRGIIKQSIKEVGYINTFTSSGLMMTTVLGSIFVTQLLFLSIMSVGPRWLYRYVKEDRILNGLVRTKAELTEAQLNEYGMKILNTVHIEQNVEEKNDGYNMYILEIPRYKPFLTALKYLLENDVEIVDISGNTKLQIKIGVSHDSNHVNTKENKLGKYNIMSSYTFYPKNHSYNVIYNVHRDLEVCILIELSELKELLKFVDENDMEVIHLFDY